MRFARLAALAALCLSTTANAATIVQYDNEGVSFGMNSFNSALGTLNSVTLKIDVTKTRGWYLTAPAGSATRTVGWTIEGYWSGPFGLQLALTGAGSSNVAMTPSNTPGLAFGSFTVLATASGTFNLNPADFIDKSFPFYLDGFDPGNGNPNGPDTTFVLEPGNTVSRTPRMCVGGNVVREDECGQVIYQLIYDYTPGGAVPEPATWAMMIGGFGAIGSGMRRRRTRVHFA